LIKISKYDDVREGSMDGSILGRFIKQH